MPKYKSNTRIIQIFEDRQTEVRLSQQNMEDLIQVKHIIGENNIIIQADGKLLVRHFVGFVQINKTRLLIYPKIANGIESFNEYNKSFEIMLKMLSFSDFSGVKKIREAQNVSEFHDDLLEIYIRLFVDELTKQIQRDINRGYNNKLENKSFIKGKVDFNETIKRNGHKRHLHYIRHDEFDENTLLNQIFKRVIQVIIKKTRVKYNKIRLKQLLLWLEDVRQIKISKDVWNKVCFTRQNIKYETAYNMAKLFYYNNSPNIKDGETSSLSFLIPVNQLFEIYLFKLFGKNKKIDNEIKYQGPIDYLANLGGRNYLRLKPDITIIKDEKIIRIIDAKYKIITENNGTFDISPGDIYQMLAYSIRYQCNDIQIIYPKLLKDDKDGLVSEFTIQNYGQSIRIQLIKVDLDEEPGKTAEKLKRIV